MCLGPPVLLITGATTSDSPPAAEPQRQVQIGKQGQGWESTPPRSGRAESGCLSGSKPLQPDGQAMPDPHSGPSGPWEMTFGVHLSSDLGPRTQVASLSGLRRVVLWVAQPNWLLTYCEVCLRRGPVRSKVRGGWDGDWGCGWHKRCCGRSRSGSRDRDGRARHLGREGQSRGVRQGRNPYSRTGRQCLTPALVHRDLRRRPLGFICCLTWARGPRWHR